ncbi:MAG: DUF2236 domain-containing protein [Bacteroidia bacterium]|nr:DUF2236 domain-containing protein [Bacteroidia bacterium]
MPSAYTNDFLDARRLEMDPLADRVVQEIVDLKGPEEAKNLFDFLIRNIDAPLNLFPEPIVNYIKTVNKLPEWADFNKINLAGDFFLDHGAKFLLLLFFKSLPELYSIVRGAEVLVQTGRLAHEGPDLQKFSRRIAETGQFLLTVMDKDALLPDHPGIQAIRKVRLIHASVRLFLKQKGWATPLLGEPINQEDIAITMTTFSVSMIDGLKQFGIEENPEKLEAYYHTWRAICSLIGLQDALNPETLAEARALKTTIMHRQSGPSAGGKALTESLIAFTQKVLPGHFGDNFPAIMIRYLNGTDLAEHLGVEAPRGCLSKFIPSFLKSQFRVMEKLEDFADPKGVILDKASKAILKSYVGLFNSYKGQNFTVPEEMLKRWS